MAKWLYQIKLGIFGQGGPRGLVNKMAIALSYSPDLHVQLPVTLIAEHSILA